jgi:hypothetical protein
MVPDLPDDGASDERRVAPDGRRYATPNGAPCPRTVRVDGTVEGSGDCLGCGCCLVGSGLV